MSANRIAEQGCLDVDLDEAEEGDPVLVEPAVIREMERTPVSLRDDRYEKAYVDSLVLCIDLRGFSSYARDKDPALVAAFLEKYSQELLAAVNGYSASYYKLLGDGAMVIWDGADSEAMSACVELFDLLRDVVDSVAELHDSSCALAGAVTFGNVYKYEIFGECSGLKYRDYIGYAINCAFRLQSIAAAGELLGQGSLADRYGIEAPRLDVERKPPLSSIKGVREDDYEDIRVFTRKGAD